LLALELWQGLDSVQMGQRQLDPLRATGARFEVLESPADVA
jgi:hypothetical protein